MDDLKEGDLVTITSVMEDMPKNYVGQQGILESIKWFPHPGVYEYIVKVNGRRIFCYQVTKK